MMTPTGAARCGRQHGDDIEAKACAVRDRASREQKQSIDKQGAPVLRRDIVRPISCRAECGRSRRPSASTVDHRRSASWARNREHLLRDLRRLRRGKRRNVIIKRLVQKSAAKMASGGVSFPPHGRAEIGDNASFLHLFAFFFW